MGTLENKQLPALHASLGDFKRSGVDEQTASGEGDEITVAVSVNTKIINKHKGGNHQFFAEGWDNYELPLSIFVKCIDKGVAYCAQLSGPRKSQNFLRSDIASVDVDSGITIDQALAHPFCEKHLTVLYSTYSHTAEEPRFRLIFRLPRMIEDAKEQEAINRALNLKFNGDRSTTDATRIFFGSSGSNPSVFDRSISMDVLSELLDQGTKTVSDSISKSSIASRQSSIRMDPEMIIETEKSGPQLLKDIAPKTSVRCPYHFDRNPSAFVGSNGKGSKFIHCIVCRTTFWMKGSADTHRNRFLPDLADVIKDRDVFIKATKQNHLLAELKFLPTPSFYSEKRINVVNTEYFKLESIPNGITLIRSPKGTGKTTTLLEVIEPLVARTYTVESLEDTDFDDPPHSTESDYRVLLIGHRQALIRDLCHKLKLNCYLDDKDDWSTSGKSRKKRYGVCLDSLRKVAYQRYDVIILDECEQVLSHFMSDTFRHSEAIFDFLSELIGSTPSVVALDADLGWTSLLTLSRMKKLSSETQSNFSQLHIHINEYKPPKRKISIFESKADLIALLMADLNVGNRVFVASNSKRMVDQLHAAIEEQFGEDKKVLAITSENSNSEEIQLFIKNVRTEAKRFDAVLCSPSLGTGVDVAFPGNEVVFNTVYGFFEALINTHTDIDQQLSRVRHPNEVRVWITNRKFNMSTDVDTVKTDLLLDHVVANTAVGYLPVKASELTELKSPYLNMASLIVSQQRASKNSLRKHFIEYKSNCGFEVITVEQDDDLAAEGSRIHKSARLVADKRNADALLLSPAIDRQQVLDIEDTIKMNEVVSIGEHRSLQRSRIEAFYRQPISAALIATDNEGRYRGKVRNFEMMFDKTKMVEVREQAKMIFGIDMDQKIPYLSDKVLSTQLDVGINRNIEQLLIYELLKLTPIFDGNEFNVELTYTAASLERLAKTALKIKKLIEGQLRLTVRSDIQKKPTQFLGELLNCVGLKQQSVKKSNKGSDRVYVYLLNGDSLGEMNQIVERRKQFPDGWEFVHNLHGLEPAPRDTSTEKQSTSVLWQIFTEHHRNQMLATEKLKKPKIPKKTSDVLPI